jgi:pyruvate dehydrogenase E2 component (dihydrolipoamide acetyltransferase)
MKAVVRAMQQYPNLNSSLGVDGESVVLKKYFHIGVAVDTVDGLVVPVLRDVDKKGIVQLSRELGEISVMAREKSLPATAMQGGCFTISSLGGIGGTFFTPIINAPEVAILGVSRASMTPIYVDGKFVPRLMLPLSLSYDHRVVDGAEAVRFTGYLGKALLDAREMGL